MITVMNVDTRIPSRGRLWLVAIAFLVGCARMPGVPAPDGTPRGAPLAELDLDDDAPDYDPWQPFNELMFTFNHDVLDRFLVKPAATGWQAITPLVARKSIARALDNLEMPRRVVNNVLQLRPVGAGREIARFVVNTTAGVAGLVDVATMIHVEKSDADTGQTLALYGLAAGPYLVLPTMPPLTVRDAIGRAADGMLDPIGYFAPFVANQARSILTAVNERSLNLKLYADVEDSVLDLYSAARNGYLQRRRLVVRRAYADRGAQWQWVLRAAEPDDAPVAIAAAGAPPRDEGAPTATIDAIPPVGGGEPEAPATAGVLPVTEREAEPTTVVVPAVDPDAAPAAVAVASGGDPS